jgi:hypothetical protein
MSAGSRRLASPSEQKEAQVGRAIVLGPAQGTASSADLPRPHGDRRVGRSVAVLDGARNRGADAAEVRARRLEAGRREPRGSKTPEKA